MMMMMMIFIFVRGGVAESYTPRPPVGYGDALSWGFKYMYMRQEDLRETFRRIVAYRPINYNLLFYLR
jgi:hypothetical protein